MTHTAVLTIRHDLLSYCTVSYVSFVFYFFFFNDTATTEIYTLSLHDALPISNEPPDPGSAAPSSLQTIPSHTTTTSATSQPSRSEEHTSELQSRLHLVCRLLLEKKKITLLDSWYSSSFMTATWPHRVSCVSYV